MDDFNEQVAGEVSPDNRGVSEPRILADIAGSFTYASYQNAIPVIRSIQIENAGSGHFDTCRIELTSSPPFLRAKSWTIDRLAPGDILPISDRKVDLDADYLAGLNEAERGEITLRLSVGGAVLDEQRFPVRLLARDEWGGVTDRLRRSATHARRGGLARRRASLER